MTIATLKIINPEAAKTFREFQVDVEAIPDIVSWYFSMYSGDPVEVYVDDYPQLLDGDYGLKNDTVIN